MDRDINQVIPRNEPQFATASKPVADTPALGRGAGGTGWFWIILTILMVGGGYYYYQYRYLPQESSKPATMPARETSVIAASARKGDMKIYLTGLGTASALNTVTLHSRVEGELVSVKFSEGNIVRQGELLAEIDPRQFQVQLAQAQGQLARDQALLDNANADLKRYQDAGDSVSKQERATQAALVAQYSAALVVNKAAVDQAKLNLEYCRIIAPITGKIGLRLMDQGNLVHANDANGLATITQLQPISVSFTLPEDDLGKVLERIKTNEPIQVVAFDRDMRNPLATGLLLAVDNQIDPSSGTIRIKASFPNEDGRLYPNQFVNARLLVQIIKDTILIPAAAIQRSSKKIYVYVIKLSGKQDKDNRPLGTVEMRTITLGPMEGDQVSVVAGLEDGEFVVTDGVDKLMPGGKVIVTMSTTAPESKRSGKSNNSSTTSSTTNTTINSTTNSSSQPASTRTSINR